MSISKVDAQDIDWKVGFQPWCLPISIGIGSDGLSITTETSMKTPWGELSLEVAGSQDILSNNEKKNEIKIIANERSKPIYIEVPKYIHVPEPSKTIIKTQKVVETKTVIQIKTVEKVVEKVIGQYIVELRNCNGKESQEFIIAGIDVLQLDVTGDTKIEMRDGRIIIDLLNSKLTKLQFKGALISGEETVQDILNKHLAKFNTLQGRPYLFDILRQYEGDLCFLFSGLERVNTHAQGLIVASEIENKVKEVFSLQKHYKPDFEYSQQVRSNCRVPYEHITLASYTNLIITSGGVGMLINYPDYESFQEPVEKKKGRKKEIVYVEKKRKIFKNKWIYFEWTDFLNLKFGKLDNGDAEKVFIKQYGKNETFEFLAIQGVVNIQGVQTKVGFTNNQIIELLTSIQKIAAGNNTNE